MILNGSESQKSVLTMIVKQTCVCVCAATVISKNTPQRFRCDFEQLLF